MARPTKLTYELIEELCEFIAQGFTYDRAARSCNISVSTFHGWMREGKQEHAEPIYKDLVAAVVVAAEYSEDEALQQVRSAAIVDRNWKAAAWFLERRFPDRYGRGKDNAPRNPEENA
jgi:hypothetical protein